MQKTTKDYSGVSRFAAFVMFAVAATVIICNPSAASNGALDGLKICSSVVIPALFPFTAAAMFFQKSGALNFIGGKLNKVANTIFGTSGVGLTVIIISLLGGYPVGAKVVNGLYLSGEISRDDAKDLLKFSVNPSPAFFISVIGVNLLSSKTAGIFLFVSNLAACLILSVINGQLTKRKKKTFTKRKTFTLGAQKDIPLSDAFVESVLDAANVIISICAWVTLFSSVSALIRSVIPNSALSAAISSVLEVTFGSVEVSKIGISPYLYSLILAFGGLSTVCQIKQAAKDIEPSFSLIILSRLLHGGLATAFSYVLFRLFPTANEVISNSVEIKFDGYPMFLPSLALLAMAVVFLIYLRPEKSNYGI